jgi:hypothetical protein
VTERTDWRARAEREAAAVLDQSRLPLTTRDRLIVLLAIAWIQGVEFGLHDALGDVDRTSEQMRAEA